MAVRRPVTQSRRHAPVDGHGETKAHHDVQHHAGDRELGRYQERLPSYGVVREATVITEAHVHRRAQKVVVEKAENDGADHRAEDEAQEQQQRRTYQKVAEEGVAALANAHLWTPPHRSNSATGGQTRPAVAHGRSPSDSEPHRAPRLRERGSSGDLSMLTG